MSGHRALPCVLVVAITLVGGCGGGSAPAPASPPVVTAAIPASGGVGGGTWVAIHGTGLASPGAVDVLIGGVAVETHTVVDDETITCETPAGTVGPADVEVTTSAGTYVLEDGFTYYPPPTLTTVTPDQGPQAGGQMVIATGSGFFENDPAESVVTICGQLATAVVVIDDTTLLFTAPVSHSANSCDVVVSNRNGSATLSQAYTYVPWPVFTSIAPSVGPTGGGTPVTLTGSSFDVDELGVTFDGVAASSVTILDDSTVTCVTPPGVPGTASVVIQTYGGMATLSDAFTWTTFTPADPLFANQWHLVNTAQYTGSTAGEDANVQGAWALGYTGVGVRVALVDDGLELAHEDLAANVVPGGSWDYIGHDTDPTGGAHGTSVAGVTGAVGANGIGVTGAAPSARLVGFNVIATGATNADLADALARNAAVTHAYNNSWGYRTVWSGQYMGYIHPPSIFAAAVATGLGTGRGGLGSIYLKAAGNSGLSSVDANIDGSNTIRGMIVIGAVNADGVASCYSQSGACLVVAAPSNDICGSHPGITTTDRTGSAGYSSTNYTSSFGGTSSATPLVAGVVAQALEANPALKWWEVPLILARTARHNDTAHADWSTNGAGHWVNHRYGFGVVDATAAVNLALTWSGRASFGATAVTQTVGQAIPDNDTTGITSTLTIPAGGAVGTVHRVVVTITSSHARATDLAIVLTSPAGTTSRLASSLSPAYDSTLTGSSLVSWRHLDEAAAGVWTLKVSDEVATYSGSFTDWTLTIEGEP